MREVGYESREGRRWLPAGQLLRYGVHTLRRPFLSILYVRHGRAQAVV